MTPGLSNFAARLREFIAAEARGFGRSAPDESLPRNDAAFTALALELFALQFDHNTAYRKICEARGITPATVSHWKQIPAVPTAAFKEFDITCLPPDERQFVFHSSGTTRQRPSRHFHNTESLALYEASLLPWFRCQGVVPEPARSADSHVRANQRTYPTQKHADEAVPAPDTRLLVLTPAAPVAPHSSLVHMFDAIRRDRGLTESVFFGRLAADGSWELDFEAVIQELQAASDRGERLALLGTAFLFVHLLDHLTEINLRFKLPSGSRVLETGGYKGRSRSLPKTELHSLIAARLGIPETRILCEYGMSELSSQAYDNALERQSPGRRAAAGKHQHADLEIGAPSRPFRFPPWVRTQIISPETGREVADGETGLLRIFDLANVFSVLAIQTEDLVIRRGEYFELIGRAALAEPRGCSLMAS